MKSVVFSSELVLHWSKTFQVVCEEHIKKSIELAEGSSEILTSKEFGSAPVVHLYSIFHQTLPAKRLFSNSTMFMALFMIFADHSNPWMLTSLCTFEPLKAGWPVHRQNAPQTETSHWSDMVTETMQFKIETELLCCMPDALWDICQLPLHVITDHGKQIHRASLSFVPWLC